jgi:hypothetical protein
MHATNKEVCSSITTLGTRLLAFENYYLREYERREAESKSAIAKATENEIRLVTRRESVRSMLLIEEIETSFIDTLLPEVIALRDELLRRLGRQEAVPEGLRGVFVGSMPPWAKLLSKTYVYLHELARPLCPEGK